MEFPIWRKSPIRTWYYGISFRYITLNRIMRKIHQYVSFINYFTQIFHNRIGRPYKFSVYEALSTPTTGIFRSNQVRFRKVKMITNVVKSIFVGVFCFAGRRMKKAGIEFVLHKFHTRNCLIVHLLFSSNYVIVYI